MKEVIVYGLKSIKGKAMKYSNTKKLAITVALFLTGNAFAAPEFICQASKRAPYYDPDFHYELTFTKRKMKIMEVRFNSTTGQTSKSHFEYNTRGKITTGASRASGLMIYTSENPMGPDPINPIYVTPELRDGGVVQRNGKMGGLIKFLGVQYTYQTYYCFEKND